MNTDNHHMSMMIIWEHVRIAIMLWKQRACLWHLPKPGGGVVD